MVCTFNVNACMDVSFYSLIFISRKVTYENFRVENVEKLHRHMSDFSGCKYTTQGWKHPHRHSYPTYQLFTITWFRQWSSNEHEMSPSSQAINAKRICSDKNELDELIRK